MTGSLVITVGAVIGVFLGLAARQWFVTSARVESSSMEPTLQPGQRLVVRRLRGVERVARSDLVLVRSDEIGRVVVKRAIGLPGERVDVSRKGDVRVNGQLLPEPYARKAAGTPGSYVVPDNALFLLGDNRAMSSDGRAWRRPYLPDEAVVGRVIRFGQRA